MNCIRTLYIIGNGFDIHHGMPTAFSDFYEWMVRHSYFDAISQIDEIYGSPDYKWWKDFEKSLGEMDMHEYALEQTRENYPDFASDEFREADRYRASYQAELDITQMLQTMKSRFAEWIETMDAPDVNKKITLTKKEAYFISFNYTPTLENLYGIPHKQVLHIHGSVLEKGEYIIGHGKSYEMLQQDFSAQEPSPSPDATPDEIRMFYEEQYDQIYEDTKEAVLNNIAALQKPVDDILEKYRFTFEELQNVERVYIYGLSFSEIDVRYLTELIHMHNSPSSIQWEISYFSQNDKEKIMKFIMNSDISEKNVMIYTLKELQNMNQLSLFDN